MKTDYLIYGLLIAVIAIAAYTFAGMVDNQPAAAPNIQNNAQGFGLISTGGTDDGNVQVDLTPKGIVNGQFLVDFAINTHSVDLSQLDLKKITTLEYSGKKIQPLSAPALSGHHNSGIIAFNSVSDLKNFKITIVGIPNIEERVFEWKS
ncbi:MAG: hypothetical protein AABX00_02220 [Nanoarchaeota archaeon]